MKKLTLILTIFLIAMLSFTACSEQNTPSSPQPPDVVQQPETPAPEDTDPPGDDKEKELVEVAAIFYSTDQEKADMIILDTSVHGNNVILMDDARVFFTDKKMNSLVKLKVKVLEQSIEVYEAEDLQSAKTWAKYIGFADNNFAEFEVLEKPFVVQIPADLSEELMEVNANELLEITIEQNEAPEANTVLKDFKRGQ